MDRTVPQALLLRQPGSMLGDLLAQGLTAIGAAATCVGSPYDVVVEAGLAAGGFSHIILRVDYFGREEFRLLPLIQREWPETVLVAYCSPGFEHKAALADLMGADRVIATDADVSRFLRDLASTARPAPRTVAAAPAPSRPLAEPPAAAPAPVQPVVATLPEPPKPAAEPAPSEAKGERAVELTEEELRMLLRPEDDA